MTTPLADFLKRSPLTLVEQAAEWGIHNGYLSRLARGKRRPSLRLARLIESKTGGAVPVESWEDLRIIDHGNRSKKKAAARDLVEEVA